MEPKQITIVAALIRNEKGDILLAKRHQPDHPDAHEKWEFVGGGIDFGEDPEDSLVREVKEESGLDVKIDRLFPKVLSDTQIAPDGRKLQIIIITYECSATGGELKSTDEEIAELKFVPLNEVKSYNSFKNIQDTVIILLSSDN